MVYLLMESEICGHFHRRENRNIPIVLFDRDCGAIDYNTVLIDDLRGG